MNKQKSALQILNDLLLLVSETEKRNAGDEAAETLLKDLKESLFRLRARCCRSTKDYKIAFVGLGNSGKSKLINALLGRKIAPTCNGACTASIVEFRGSEELKITATLAGTGAIHEEQEFSCGSEEELAGKLEEMCAHGEGGGSEWSRVHTYLPADILKNGLIIVDTPGFGAAGEFGAHDDKTVAEFLQKEVAQIFWIGCTESGGISSRELQFYEKFLKWRCDDLILTNGDDWDESDRRDFIKKDMSPYVSKFMKFYFVNGKQGFSAVKGGKKNSEEWEKSGLKLVEDRIRLLKDEDSRSDGVVKRIRRLGRLSVEYVRDHMSCGNGFFTPTLRANFIKKYQNDPALAEWIELLK